MVTDLSTEELSQLSAVKVYESLLNGDIKRFPNGFWADKDGFNNGVACVRYLFEVILKYDKEDIKKYASTKLFRKYKLLGMLRWVFDDSPYMAINSAYNGVFKPWELSKVTQYYWNEQTGIEATRWLILDKLKFTENDIKEKLSKKLFTKNGLYGMIVICFSGSPIEAVRKSIPEFDFEVWEYKSIPKDFWTKERAIEATRWLISTKLKLTDDELKEKLSYRLFEQNGLGGMLQTCFNSSAYDALNESYGYIYNREDFKFFSKNSSNKKVKY